MTNARDEFGSKYGFILAAAGSAVGLGNIWSFPTNAADNGGGAFLLVYLLMTLVLAYPVFVTELVIGRHAKANVFTALKTISSGEASKFLSSVVGIICILTASLILAFYAIVAGWMLAMVFASILSAVGQEQLANWFSTFGLSRNITFLMVAMLLTSAIVLGGVKRGIEKWSTRLMPSLLLIMIALIITVMTMKGATQGLKVYLLPDIRQINGPLILSALGQAFFSMSLGVGTMMIYGSYLSKKEHLPRLAAGVTLMDIGVAFLAGLLILPAIFVAQNVGVNVVDEAGKLIANDELIFVVLPALFENIGAAGVVIAIVFFSLLSIAALTSSISMLEVPVAYISEAFQLKRPKAVLVGSAIIATMSAIIAWKFELLFGLVITITTQYSQPMVGLLFCIYLGWVWHRQAVLEEIKAGFPEAEQSWFWKIWPLHIKFVCPAIIFLIVITTIL